MENVAPPAGQSLYVCGNSSKADDGPAKRASKLQTMMNSASKNLFLLGSPWIPHRKSGEVRNETSTKRVGAVKMPRGKPVELDSSSRLRKSINTVPREAIMISS
jgi:hypothetical protein